MGEINFLANNTSSKNSKDEKSENEKKEKKWSETNNSDSKKTSSIFASKKNKVVPQKTDTEEDKARIEKSRQEVLDMLGKDKHHKKDKANKEHEKQNLRHSGVAKENDKKKYKKSATWFDKFFDKNKSKNEQPILSDDKKQLKKINKESKEKALEKTNKKEKKGGILGSDNKIGIVEEPRDQKKTAGDSLLSFNDKTWSSSDVLATNLIDKSEMGFFDPEKKLKYIIISIISSLCIVGALYLGLLYWEHTELKKMITDKNEIAKLASNVADLEKGLDVAKNFQARLNTASLLLDKHIYWTNFFSFLEEATLSKTYYSGSLELAMGEELSLLARFPSYKDLKNQLIVFADDKRINNIKRDDDVSWYEEIIAEDDDAIDLSLSQIEATSTEPVIEKGVEANLTLEIDENVFFKNNIASSSVNIDLH